jgi:hypothetical protein
MRIMIDFVQMTMDWIADGRIPFANVAVFRSQILAIPNVPLIELLVTCSSEAKKASEVVVEEP